MTDDRFDEVLKDAAREYNPPPEAPRDLMWARIQAVRRERAKRRRRMRELRSTWARWGIGLAAAVLVGVLIGRATIERGGEPSPLASDREASPPPLANLPDPEGGESTLPYRMATTEHLSQAEMVLTSFRRDPRIGQQDPQFYESARRLLTSTRLLLDSPAAQDPTLRTLLEDLELMLVQIVGASAADSAELKTIDEGLETRGLLPRLRSAIPAGRFEVGA